MHNKEQVSDVLLLVILEDTKDIKRSVELVVVARVTLMNQAELLLGIF